MTNRTYPVICERRLDRPRTPFLRFQRRDLSELPTQEPGTVLVFEVGGRFAVFDERRHLTGREDAVIEAVAVSLVDLRARLMPVEVRIPSQSPADDFRVRVTFRCKVEEPEVVVRDGLLDIARPLLHHVKRDRELESMGIRYHVDQINEVREEVAARLRAYCTLHPPRLSGMDVRLLTVDVATPQALVDHATRIRDTEWQHIHDVLSEGFETEKATKLADLIRSGPEGLEGLAIAKGETTAALAADRAYERESEVQHRITELLTILQKDGHLDRLNVDADILVEAFTNSIRARRSEPAPQIESRSRREPARSISADGDDDLLLDEDELNDD